MGRPDTILHIIERDRWSEARTGSHVIDPSLAVEGFIHCSTVEQVLTPANERFSGRTDLVLLVIDTTLVSSDIVFEDCYESGMEFPHVYGPIPTTAVKRAVPFPPNPDGSFDLPQALQQLE